MEVDVIKALETSASAAYILPKKLFGLFATVVNMNFKLLLNSIRRCLRLSLSYDLKLTSEKGQ
jgi:hypothetical protein